MKNSIKEIVIVGINVILITISSWIEIPLIIPITLQNLVLFVIIGVFGFKTSLKSIIFYILIGLLGMPVFSNFSSGIIPFINYTGGYLVSFIFYPFIYLLFDKIVKQNEFKKYLVSFAISLLISYILGTVWFYFILRIKEEISFFYALTFTVLPFIVSDVIKLFVSILIINRLKKNKEWLIIPYLFLG